MKPWKQQRNAATARRRTLLFQKPEPDVRELATTTSITEQSPWEWISWIESHDEAHKEQAIAQTPAKYRNLITRYIKMKQQRKLFEKKRQI